MTTIWRVHGTDTLGTFSFDCYSYEEFMESWDLWLEEYDEEEGWQA